MFGKLIGETESQPDGNFITARLNARVQPLDRGDVYEDPLDAQLKQRGLGEVTGGGTQLGAEGEIEFCDLEIEVAEVSGETLAALGEMLEGIGVPKGSKLIVEGDGREIEIGTQEGLAVYLNGTDLPDEVYEKCDFEFIWTEFERLLGQDGKVVSYWQGPTETALYCYGPSFETMRGRLQEFIDSYPLCQKSRVVQVA